MTEAASQPAPARRETVQIRVSGTVQGVGFRPTVWRLAQDEGIVGEVLNDASGVLITTTGDALSVSQFLERLQKEAPPLSRIESVETRRLPQVIEFSDFHIAASAAGENRARVTPDAATCPDCREEVLNPRERRYRYPFANCTNCGPRFTIVKEVPYDRPRTTMSDFPMCEDCEREYADPADRRFHAQPIACAECGPGVWIEPVQRDAEAGASDGERVAVDDPIKEAVARLNNGEIVAIRGLGGFHLACDATDDAVVQRLRKRKRRYGKPFALMARNLEVIRRYCAVTPREQELLESAQAPIVVLRVAGANGADANGTESLPAALAPGLASLGFMLPYSPLHLLLLRHFDRPLVMTSGNTSDEPQVTDLEEAREKLSAIADAFLMHDRDIANRIDDSVVRVVTGRTQMVRRARGYAPSAIRLPAGFERAPDLLAYGGELKATFCLLKDGAAIVSQHQGDLEEEATFDDYERNLELYTAIYEHQPRLLAADRHPEYLSSKRARQQAAAERLPLEEIQHHHAHVASCMAENGLPLDGAPVLGIALDGLGYGDDGTIWGGELLLADYAGYRRLGAFRPVAMPGGALAVREPWRNTYAHLVAAVGWQRFVDAFPSLPLRRYLAQKPLATIDRMLERGLNVPLASSCGRLFDAVAGALNICADRVLFEGQGAMELETLAEGWLEDPTSERRVYPFCIEQGAGSGLFTLDPRPMWTALLRDLAKSKPPAAIAAAFQLGLAVAICDLVERLRAADGAAAATDTVALSGGCFQNGLLLVEVSRGLEKRGMRCLLHNQVPANDGGLALGQAAIAAARALRNAGGVVETS